MFQLLWLLLFLPILDSSIWISWLRSWAVMLSLYFDPNSSLFIFLFNRILVSIQHISCFLWNILFSFLHIYIFYLSLLYWYFQHFSSLIFCLIVCNSVICIAFFFPLFVLLLWNILPWTHLLFFCTISIKTTHSPARYVMRNSSPPCARALALTLSSESWIRIPERLVWNCRSQLSTSST